jgi:hypothetical protein
MCSPLTFLRAQGVPKQRPSATKERRRHLRRQHKKPVLAAVDQTREEDWSEEPQRPAHDEQQRSRARQDALSQGGLDATLGHMALLTSDNRLMFHKDDTDPRREIYPSTLS